MPRIYNFFGTTKASTIVAWFILIFTLLPLLLLCVYSVPLGDDFWYAAAFRKNGMIGTQVLWYNEWSGRYMATFLISTLNPLSYGYTNLGFLHPMALLLGTIFSLRFLINTVIDVFDLPISKILSLSILLFFYLNYIPDIGESFYWMAGAYTYQVPVIFLFLYIGLIIKYLRGLLLWSNIIYATLALFCLFIILGSNEVIVVYVCLMNALLTAYFYFRHRRNFLRFLPLLLVTIGLAYLMITADGNFARAGLFQKPSFHFLKSTINSLSRGLFVMSFWIPTLMLLLLSVPGFSNINIQVDLPPSNDRKKRVAVIVAAVVVLVGIVFIGFFPSIYSTLWIPQRAYTPIFIVFIISFVVVFLSMLKYFPILSQLNTILTSSSKTSNIFLCILIIALAHNSNVMNAYVDLTSGKASSYHKQVISTYQMLEEATQDTIFVEELAKRPLILPIRWPQQHNSLANSIWQEYYNVEKVELK